jgi:hypothetical protein
LTKGEKCGIIIIEKEKELILMERKIQNKEEFLAAIKREKERRKKVAEAQEKKLAEIEKKKLQTLIQKGR